MYKKNNHLIRAFVIFIVIFPIVISFGTSIINESWLPLEFERYAVKVLLLLKEYMGYYATALSITFTVYAFSMNQKHRDMIYEKRELEKNEELIKAQEEMNLIKQQEIENKRDQYRPTFIVRDNKIELLMRNNDLLLENICIYIEDSEKYIGTKRSGENINIEMLENKLPSNFYITAKTVVGEKIIFGYLFGEETVYRCLKKNGNPICPSGSEGYNYQKEIDENWNSYNDFNENCSKDIEMLFFYNSRGIRENLALNNNQSIERILSSSNNQELFNCLFKELLNGYELICFENEGIVSIIKYLDDFITNKYESFNLNVEKLNINYLLNTVEKNRLMILLPEYKIIFNKNSELSVYKIYKHVMKYIVQKVDNSDDKKEVLAQALRILAETFESTTVSKDISNSFLSIKAHILKEIRFKK